MSKLGQTVKVRAAGAGGLPDWVEYDPGWKATPDEGSTVVDLEGVGAFCWAEYLAQQNPDGTWTFDAHGDFELFEATLPLPAGQWFTNFVPTGFFVEDLSVVMGGVGSVMVFTQPDLYTGPNATGVLDQYGFFWMADGSPMSAASVAVTSGLRLFWSIRFHARQSG